MRSPSKTCGLDPIPTQTHKENNESLASTITCIVNLSMSIGIVVAYTVFQTVERHGVYSAAYGTVHYKEPLKTFKIRMGHSPGFGLPSVAILP